MCRSCTSDLFNFRIILLVRLNSPLDILRLEWLTFTYDQVLFASDQEDQWIVRGRRLRGVDNPPFGILERLQIVHVEDGNDDVRATVVRSYSLVHQP